MAAHRKNLQADLLALAFAVACLAQVFVGSAFSSGSPPRPHSPIAIILQYACAAAAAATSVPAFRRDASAVALCFVVVAGCLMLATGAIGLPSHDLAMPTSLFGAMLLVAANIAHLDHGSPVERGLRKKR